MNWLVEDLWRQTKNHCGNSGSQKYLLKL
jgi:hypothetical protein